jgi:signal transduction histidine kinase
MRTDPIPKPIGRMLGWFRGLPPALTDAALAGAFGTVVIIERLRDPLDGALMVAAIALTVALTASVWLRRRVPLTAFGLGAAALSSEALIHVATEVSPYATLIGAYSLGRYATPARARAGVPIIVACVLLYFVSAGRGVSFEPIGVLVMWLAAWAVGSSTARQREERERARRAIQSQVVAEERTRMARELHDIIGHTVNLLVVQAGAARLMLDKDPAMTRQLLTSMEHTGRESLADLDRVLGTLRTQTAEDRDEDRADRADRMSVTPSPGLAQLPDLAKRLTESGVDVKLTIDDTIELPRDLDMSAYRIVQEALTNALKHAAPCTATVTCTRTDRDVVVEVADDGPGPSRQHRPGRGLLGIAERVSMCGGAFEHGEGIHGGFTVRAVLPLP